MKDMARIGLAAAALLAIGSGAAKADLTIKNEADRNVWMTMYDAFGQIYDSRCLTPNTSHNYSKTHQGNLVYARAEYKEKTGCGGKTLADSGRGPAISVGPNTLKIVQHTSNKVFVK